MTETISLADPPVAPPEQDFARILMNLVVAFLAPMFLDASGGSLEYARAAATATLNAYRIRDQADVLSIAQIIGFGLAALGSLSLSMVDDIPVAMMLRLRGNANACHRSAEQNRRALGRDRTQAGVLNGTAHPRGSDTAPPDHDMPDRDTPDQDTPDEDQPASGDLSDAGLRQGLAEARQLLDEARDRFEQAARSAPHASAAPHAAKATVNGTAASIDGKASPSPGHKARWAIAMVGEADRLVAEMPELPPDERSHAAMRVSALTSVARGLLTGLQPLPREPARSDGALDPTG